jgi:hypothetical protein
MKPTNPNLWVDDVREPPGEDWDWVKSFHAAILNLEVFDYHTVSLDHDLGCFYGNKEMTGRDILNWLIGRKLEGLDTPKIVKVHSANSAAWPSLQVDIDRFFVASENDGRQVATPADDIGHHPV